MRQSSDIEAGTPLRLGIAGLGAAGVQMLEAAFQHPDIEVRAVADVNTELLGALGESVPRSYQDFQELCDDRDVEAIYIASPTVLHLPHTLAAIAAGKDVIVEKPMDADVDGALHMAGAAREAGRVLVVGHSQSFEPFVRAIQATARRHALGRCASILIQEETDWMRRPRMAEELDESLGGGPLLRQGAHLVDTLRFLTDGAPVANIAASGYVAEGDRCHGSFLATMTVGGAAAVLAYNGYGGLRKESPALSPGPGSARARKGRNNLDALTLALGRLADKTRSLAPISLHLNERRLLLMYERGQITSNGRDITVAQGHQRLAGDRLSLLSPGRHAVLDELLSARDGSSTVHDGAWGAENLRICLAMASAAGRTTAGSHSLRTAKLNFTHHGGGDSAFCRNE